MSVPSPGRRLRLVEEDPSARLRLRLVVALLWALSLAGTWLWLREAIAPQFAEVGELAQQALTLLFEV